MATYRVKQSDNPFRNMTSTFNRSERVSQSWRAYAPAATREELGTDNTRIGNRIRARNAVDSNGVYTLSDRVAKNAQRLTRGSMKSSFERTLPGQISMFDNDFSVQPNGDAKQSHTRLVA